MKTKVQEVMTTDVLVANESTPFKEIAELLARQRISAVPVLDAAGQLVGVVSEADLLLKEEHPDAAMGAPWFERRHRLSAARRPPRWHAS
jgi:CBS domain-containing protein